MSLRTQKVKLSLCAIWALETLKNRKNKAPIYTITF